MQNLLLKALICLLLLLSNDSATNEYDQNLRLDAYADSYCQVVNDKFLLTELQTNVDLQNAEETIKSDILRLEHLYQSKWAKEFLKFIRAEDKKLVYHYNDEYRKALEEDDVFKYKVLANKRLYNRMKRHIAKKWENRKNLDIAEAQFWTEPSENLRKYKIPIAIKKKDFKEAKKAVNTTKANLKVLETMVVIATHRYRGTQTYLRGVGKGISTYDSLNDNEITEAYWKARTDFDIAIDELKDRIKLLEMTRFEFLKYQTLEDGIKWLLAEMKEDANQF
ncbi:unnamed protein product [Trichobilharzia szidati]|nr:unnamed protein product [Trichobilharzia szidati]